MHYDCKTVIDAPEDVAAAKSSGQAAQDLKKKGKPPGPSPVRRRSVRFGGLLGNLPSTAAHRAGYERCAGEMHHESMGKGMWLLGVTGAESRFAVHYVTSPKFV